jgi:hypothetical protein
MIIKPTTKTKFMNSIMILFANNSDGNGRDYLMWMKLTG